MKALQGRKRFLLFIDELALPPVAKDELGAALETEAKDEPDNSIHEQDDPSEEAEVMQ